MSRWALNEEAMPLPYETSTGASLERVPRVPRNPQIFELLWSGTRKILMGFQEILYIDILRIDHK